jgi:predicted metalloprotease
MLSAALLVAGCSATIVDGRPVSMLYDPSRVGGLPVTDGPSGPRPNAPKPTGTVENTDGSDLDREVLLAINDIEDFWHQNYRRDLKGQFTPVSNLVSYDSEDRSSPVLCGDRTYHEVNAFYCESEDLIAWDRGVMVPAAKKYFGDMSINGLLAHEYGHAVQAMANLVNKSTPVLVSEQQADCFAGVYLRWVAEGQSHRFTLSTADGLNHVLAGAITIRDPVLTPDDSQMIEEGHGTALDRISAFQMGFDGGSSACAAIDMDEINTRRGDLPISLEVDQAGNLETGQVAIDRDTLDNLMEALGQIFSPKNPPKLVTDSSKCPGGQEAKPAAYCAENNTIVVDLAALKKMGAARDEANMVLPQGDNSALSVLTSRYMLALEHERGVSLDTPVAAMRTACLTGFAQRKMAEPTDLPSGNTLVLTAGDLDEAVSGLLTNGLVASDVNGKTVPAGFTRIVAFRSGLLGDVDECYARFA